MTTKYIMNFSGGLCSYFAAHCLLRRVPRENITLLFADTNFEDEDLYRFLNDASTDLQIPVTRIADGRTPWEVFFDQRFLGNSRIDPCSKILKRELLDKWHRDNCSRCETVICIGLSRAERKRYLKFKWKMRARGWRVQAPAMETDADKQFMLEFARDRGVEPPALYEDGFAHNNCGGFCVKQGQAGFRLLLQKRRDFYLYNEAMEEGLRGYLGKDVSIMKDRRGGTTKTLTMRAFREGIESGLICTVPNDQGGCGCALDD